MVGKTYKVPKESPLSKTSYTLGENSLQLKEPHWCLNSGLSKSMSGLDISGAGLLATVPSQSLGSRTLAEVDWGFLKLKTD